MCNHRSRIVICFRHSHIVHPVCEDADCDCQIDARHTFAVAIHSACGVAPEPVKLFRVWPIKNVGAIFGQASAAAQRITCLAAGFKRLFCSIYTNKIQHKYTSTYSDMLLSNIILNLPSTLHLSIVQLAVKSV